ncbi:MAG: penicillin-binding protein 1C [Pseudomonadota bacterium]
MRQWPCSIGWLLGVVVLLPLTAYLLAPRPDLYGDTSYSSAWFDRNGRLLRLGLAEDDRYRLKVGLEQVAPVMQQATLLYEDQDFYQHDGVDFAALLRAAWQTWVIAERRIGGSTLTMQVARLRYHLPHSLWGKLQQIVRALQIERHYSKRQILSAYFNLAPYGRNIEGVEAASLIYFDKSATELTLPEALALSVVPQNPVRRNPTTNRGSLELFDARSRLFARWVEQHPGAGKRRVQLELPLAIRPPERLPFHAPHFVNSLESGSGRIDTTLDLGLQRLLENGITRFVARRGGEGINNAAALLLNSQTMEVEARVGSASFFNKAISGQVDGSRAKRSPGSALKPFIYALAMDQGLIHPMTMLKDSPKRFGAYTPENFDQQFLGPLFARDALIKSRNVPAVNLTAALAGPGLYGLLQQTGITGMREPKHYGLALALGGMEVTMEELVGLYAMLANGGEWQPLRSLHGKKQRGDRRQLLSPEASFITLEMLRDNPPPQGEVLHGVVAQGPKIAWKTGTSYAFRDAWAVGVVGPYVLAVWVGNFDGSSNPAFVGRTAAGPLLFDLFGTIERQRGGLENEPPEPGLLNVSRIPMCADTGDLPGRHCPRTIPEWFIPGVSPIKVSTVHRAIPIDRASGKRACFYDPATSRFEVYEFWPSDLLQIFRQSGLPRRLPPPFLHDCSLEQQAATGLAPQIKSPSAVITYTLRADRLAEERIPFEAVTDADVKTLYWFVDNRLAGQGQASELFFWPAAAGDYVVSVLDDHGRGAEVRMQVRLVN